MSRYFTRPVPRAYFDDEYPNQIVVPNVTVDDHVPADTGLVDVHGRRIWRAPNPMGFGKDGEW